MNSKEMMSVAERLRKCAEELLELAESINTTACNETKPSQDSQVGATFADVGLPEVMKRDSGRWRMALPVVVGRDEDGNVAATDLNTLPHLIVGGAMGQGKSRFVHSLLCGLIASRSPEEVKLLVVDTKCVEYSQYAGVPHLCAPVITDMRRVVFALRWATIEMQKRLEMFAAAQVRDIARYNSRQNANLHATLDSNGTSEGKSSLPKTLPYVVIVIDDFSYVAEMIGEELETEIQRIAAVSRAVGIHIVLVTQRADEKSLPSGIKANIPGRIAFHMVQEESKALIGTSDAESISGTGRCLFKDKNGRVLCVKTLEITDSQIDSVVAEAKRKYAVSDEIDCELHNGIGAT